MAIDEKPPQGELFTGVDNPHAAGSEASSRWEEMRAEAIAFHVAHPEVWRLMVRFSFELIGRGFKKAGIGLVMERIRWETATPDVDIETQFKINNNHHAFYSRAFMRKYPEHDGFFRTRRQKSHDQPATGLPPLGPKDFD